MPVGVAGDERILYVEDDQHVAGVVQAMLQRLGYRVTLSPHGADALEVIRRAPDRFDLVVTDHMMPRLTGMALAEQLQAIRPDLPVVLVTGLADTVSAAQLSLLGIRERIQKPVQVTELSLAIRRVLGSRAPDNGRDRNGADSRDR